MKYIKKLIGLILSLVLIGGILFLWYGRQDISDWVVLRNYSPSAEVVALAESTTMSDYGRRIFYVNHPYIAPADTINAECGHESSIVIGCFTFSGGIYIYNITDPRLNGVKEVTAAHEMLHAAYVRLSDKQRQEVDNLTELAYAKVTDQHIKDNVENYRKQDPSVLPNELHSILATEVSDLPPKLEEYYKKYFINRLAVVAFSDHYQAEFNSREQKVADYDKQLAELKNLVEQARVNLTDKYGTLIKERARLDGLLKNNQISEYNQDVPNFNASVGQYNNLVKQTDLQITDYNNLVFERNQIAIEVKDLAKSIDSRPQSF